jgi:hypothetical protein
MSRQARRSGPVMRFDAHMIAGSRACSTPTPSPTHSRTPPTGQARTMPKPWGGNDEIRAVEQHAQTPLAPSTTRTTVIDRKARIVTRLRQILRIRDQAYERRDVTILNTIYTSDCSCLEGDGRAIRDLLEKERVWRGSPSSIQVRRVEQVNDRQWIVTAVFQVPPLRVEEISGQLVESYPAERNLFRFVLVKSQLRDPRGIVRTVGG